MKARDAMTTVAGRAKAKAVLAATTLTALTILLGASVADAEGPVVTIDPVASPSYTTATVKGEVTPDTEAGETYWFVQYALKGTDHGGSGEEGWHQTGLTGIPAGPTTEVSRELSSFTAGATYEVRLGAVAFEGAHASENRYSPTIEEFTTLAVAKPQIEGLEVSQIAGSTAHFSATIDPGSGGDGSFGTDWRFECTPVCNGLQGGTVPAGSPREVEVDATGLLPNTLYTVRLFASNAGGEDKATETFATEGSDPLVQSFAAGPLTATTAWLNGEVDPQGSSTVYWYEWGTSDCSAPASSCQSVPAERDASAGDGPYYRWTQRKLTGLQPNTTYHFRLVAENPLGTTEGPDRTFTTVAPEAPCTNQGMPGTGFLPDCRAWEMVSPPEKNGIEVIPQTFKTHIRTDGDAVTYSALGGFGGQEGSSFDSEYMAERTAEAGTNGWASHGINPLAHSVTFSAADANGSSYVNAFTPDLHAAVYKAWRPLTVGAPNVADVSNLYRVTGLDGGPKSIELLTNSVNPIPPLWAEYGGGFFLKQDNPQIAGASTDLSHVFFESSLRLTADATPYESQEFFCQVLGGGCLTQLYENYEGQVRLVGRLPHGSEAFCDDQDGPPCLPATSSQTALSATGKLYSQEAISSDGRRVYFKTPANANSSGQLFLREDGERTYKLTDNGLFWDASRDGSRAFFSTSEQLLPADTDGSPDLYMWDREAPEGDRLTLISAGPTGVDGFFETTIGSSPDGHSVFFVFDGQLIPGQREGDALGLYAWRGGQLKYIGSFTDSNVANSNSPRKTWSFAGSARPARISPDGRYLLFVTTSDEGFAGHGGALAYEQDKYRELYLYDTATGHLRCASCDPNGAPATAAAEIAIRNDSANSHPTSDSAQALTDNGRYVLFNSADPLVSEDTNGQSDAYEYDSRTEEVHLLSSGTEETPSYVIDESPDGRDAFIVTREQLVGWDHDEAYDLYDARVGGGFPEPVPVPAPCAGEACKGAPAPAPAPGAAVLGSTSVGAGNPRGLRRCPKGRHRAPRHGRKVCVKKKHKQKHRAGHNREAGR